MDGWVKNANAQFEGEKFYKIWVHSHVFALKNTKLVQNEDLMQITIFT